MYKLRILEYDDIINELKRITVNKNFKRQRFPKTKYDNIEIPYYTYGKGDNHIIVVGGTHGSEIISVDFVLRLMEDIVNRGLEDYTFHFIPLLNPEGYIISTSMLRTLIKKDIKESDLERISREYYINYRQDDIDSKNENKKQKLHQKMFDKASYLDIPNKYINLKNSIKKIYEENKDIPRGSIVVWRGNGSGIETNRDHHLNTNMKYVKNSIRKYGKRRYNNIPDLVKGPLGALCVDINDKTKHTPENTFLLKLIEELYNDKKYTGLYLYHGTGAQIYYRPSIYVDKNIMSEDKRNNFIDINTQIANCYKKNTKCVLPNGSVKNGYTKIGISNLNGMDELLRVIYPAVLLIELSFMGGNPIGPYADKINNYIPTIKINLNAFYESIKINKELKNKMYKNENISLFSCIAYTNNDKIDSRVIL